VSTPLSHKLLIRPDLADAIKTPGDLKGKIIASNGPGSVTTYEVAKILGKDGVGIKDVDIKILSFVNMGIALTNKAVDAALVIQPWATQYVEKGIAKVFADPDDYADPKPLTIAVNMVNTDWAGKNKDLMRRYYLVQQAREAEVVGILVGTLSASQRTPMLRALKALCRRAARKHYVFIMGKLNAAKLANFAEVGVYVLLGSAEHSLLDAKDFYRPVVTPYELHVALAEGAEKLGSAARGIQDAVAPLQGVATNLQSVSADAIGVKVGEAVRMAVIQELKPTLAGINQQLVAVKALVEQVQQ
jgi:hypothetical protein